MRSAAMRGLALAVTAAVGSAGLAACGSSAASLSSLPAPQALRAAAANLYDASGLTMTVKLDADATRVKELSNADPTGSKLTDEQAKLIAGGSLVLQVLADKGKLADLQPLGLGALRRESISFTLNAGDGHDGLVEMRYVGSSLYARADVREIAALANTSYTSLQDDVSSFPPALAPAGRAALAGKWLKLPIVELLDAVSGLTGGKPLPTPDPSQAKALQGALSRLFDKDVTVTRPGDSTSLGAHYLLTGSARTLATDLLSALRGELANLPGGANSFDATNVPDRKVTVDAYVQGRTLHALKLDLAQFAQGSDKAAFGGQPLNVEADFDQHAAIAAPAGATDLNLGSILAGLGALSRSGSAG